MFTKPYMDYKYGRISAKEAVIDGVVNVAKEGATIVAGGAALKRAGKLAEPVLSKLLSKAAANTRSARNLKNTLSSQKTFTQSEMKEILSSKANDNFWMNDNNVYMSRGKVVNGESVGVGRVSSNVVGRASYSGAKSKSYNVGNPSVSKGKITRNDWRSLEVGEQRKVRDDFFKNKVSDQAWAETNHTIGGRKAWHNESDKHIYFTKDGRHNDIEVWRVSGKRAEHLGSMEPIEGTMYKKPNHPPAKFE